ncbi:MAG: alpha/beta hydrolase [Gammaproteobacteria bacterium]|nr:alpha/beta hydrolase [Gammaproteobacteria bacterium]
MDIEINGQQMFYSTGNGSFSRSQPSVVFIHGAGLDHSVWVLPSRYFARHGYNVVSLDLPAHGRSQGQPLDSIEEMANWVSELIRSIGIPSASIVGHSMGSLVALTIAANFEAQVRSLALLGTAVPMRVSDQLLAAAEANSHDAIDMSNMWSHSQTGQMGGNDNPGMWMMGAEQRLLERTGKGVYFTDFTACNNFSMGVELAQSITCPALIIAGEADIMTPPRNAKTVAALLPNCRVTVLDNCGHSMLSEKPDRLLDELITIV